MADTRVHAPCYRDGRCVEAQGGEISSACVCLCVCVCVCESSVGVCMCLTLSVCVYVCFVQALVYLSVYVCFECVCEGLC